MNNLWEPSLNDALARIHEMEAEARVYQEKQRLMSIAFSATIDAIAVLIGIVKKSNAEAEFKPEVEKLVYDMQQKVRIASHLLHEARKTKVRDADEESAYLSGGSNEYIAEF